MVVSHFVAAAAIVVALVVAAAVLKGQRTRSARQRVELMHAAAHHPLRRLVEVLRPLRGSQSGDFLLVLDARTGQEATVWLRRQSLRPGDLALLVWMDRQWVLMDRLPARRLRLAVATWRPVAMRQLR